MFRSILYFVPNQVGIVIGQNLVPVIVPTYVTTTEIHNMHYIPHGRYNQVIVRLYYQVNPAPVSRNNQQVKVVPY